MLKISQIKQKSTKFLVTTKTVFLAVFVPSEENCFLPSVLKSKYLFWYGAGLLTLKIALISLVLILPSTSFFSAITTDRLITLINQERQARNLSTLALNVGLNSVADLKVNDMLMQNYFDHTSPQGVTPWYWFKRIGYNYAFAGENLAMGFTDTETVFQAWMDSPTHRDNILNPNFQEMGLAVKSGQIQAHADTLAVLVFGKQQATATKTQIAQTPVKTNTPTPAPRGEQNELYGATPKKTPVISAAPSVELRNMPSPSIAPPGTISPTPSASPEQIELKTILGEQPQNPSADQSGAAPDRIGYAPRVLGAFASKSDEIFKSLYLYFTLFLAIALGVNIFVKIRIQYWPTIVATTLIILLSSALVFI